jgi:hypothetical protein
VISVIGVGILPIIGISSVRYMQEQQYVFQKQILQGVQGVQAQSTTTSGNTPWQEFGVFIGPFQKHTGVFHNENGVFIPWTTMCAAEQSYLVESCGSLISSDGSLTNDGDRAVGCITNGAILTVIAGQFNLPIDTIRSLLGGLAPLTGCGGIVNLNQIQSSPDLQRLVQIAGSLAH